MGLMKNVAIIGCGFVAHYYLLTLSKSESLKVAGVLDSRADRAATTAAHYSIPKVYQSLAELLADDTTEIVLNLTDPRSHYDVTLACLEAGKHVYSEKPLAMTVEAAKQLVEVAERRSLRISCAPCSMLGEAAQTIWKAIRDGKIGRVHLAYAELDEEMLHKMHLENMTTILGVHWPAKDEYEIGVTLEHAGYYLAWLAAFFGPAKSVTAFASCLIPDKMPGIELNPPDSPDFTVACIEFASGTVARVTCGLAAQHDHSFTLFGETGIITVEEAWNYGAPIWIRPLDWNRESLKTPAMQLAGRVWRKLGRHFPFLRRLEKLANPLGKILTPVRPRPEFAWDKRLIMDFSRGVHELAQAIDEKRESRLSTRFSLHITELALAIHDARKLAQPYRMTTTFDPIEPMPWAQ